MAEGSAACCCCLRSSSDSAFMRRASASLCSPRNLICSACRSSSAESPQWHTTRLELPAPAPPFARTDSESPAAPTAPTSRLRTAAEQRSLLLITDYCYNTIRYFDLVLGMPRPDDMVTGQMITSNID